MSRIVKASSSAPSDDGPPRPGPTVSFDVPSELEQTASQVGVLLKIVEEVGAFTEDAKGLSDGVDHDETVKEKAVDTVVQALHQLDNVLNQQDRWVVKTSRLEATHTALLEESFRLQALATKEAKRPYRRLGAEIGKLRDGSGWAAIAQQDGMPPLVAAGRTPDEAMRNFDRLVEDGYETFDMASNKPLFGGKKKALPKKGSKSA